MSGLGNFVPETTSKNNTTKFPRKETNQDFQKQHINRANGFDRSQSDRISSMAKQLFL